MPADLTGSRNPANDVLIPPAPRPLTKTLPTAPNQATLPLNPPRSNRSRPCLRSLRLPLLRKVPNLPLRKRRPSSFPGPNPSCLLVLQLALHLPKPLLRISITRLSQLLSHPLLPSRPNQPHNPVSQATP